MRNESAATLCGLLVGAWLATAVAPARAAVGDCAQPQTAGVRPTATDCLAILSVAVGVRTCDPFEIGRAHV
jgi:hypothetical protein